MPKWAKVVVAVAVLSLGAVTMSAALNNEVSRRLATVPPSSTSPTTTIPPQTTTTAAPARVLGARVTRPVPTTSSTTSTTVVETPEQFEAATPSELIAELDALPVADEHTDGYRRARFGFYRDVDADHCDARREVAIAEAMDLVMNTHNCNIQSGKWFSPFDGAKLNGPDAITVTHLVSLRETWESGAWQWDEAARNAYLNDIKIPETMLVVSPMSAQQRDDEDPGAWLPTYESYRCDYLKAWVYLKTLYKLSVDPGEREAIAAAALHC
jgi:hypothetical protein